MSITYIYVTELEFEACICLAEIHGGDMKALRQAVDELLGVTTEGTCELRPTLAEMIPMGRVVRA